MFKNRKLPGALAALALASAVVSTSACHAHYGAEYSLGYVTSRLPHGYISLRYDGYPHYFYDGLFYRQHRRGYVVVSPPLGAFLRRLPRGARAYRRGGVEYKEYRGVEYERVKKGRDRGYRVRGRAGRRGGRPRR